MKSISFFAVLALAANAVANPLPEPEPVAGNSTAPALEKRGDAYFSMWTNINFHGNFLNIKNPESAKCYQLQDPFYKSISSAGPNHIKNFACSLWNNDKCKGSSKDRATLHYPGSKDLRKVDFNDKAVAYQCLY